jgi:hypothetical protein
MTKLAKPEIGYFGLFLDPTKLRKFFIKKRHRHHLISEKNALQHLFTLVRTIFEKKLVIVSPVRSLPVGSMKMFLLDSLVCQGNADGKSMMCLFFVKLFYLINHKLNFLFEL